MYKEKLVAVVVPAYNEENLIERAIHTIPIFVDKIIVVNDCSTDKTIDIVSKIIKEQPDRIILINHVKNQGVGGAIATGYKWCRDQEMDATAVMAGDAQMDPRDLSALLDPVVSDEVDYAKGNRLISGEAWTIIPRIRYMGNAILSLLTKIASGYWHIADSQTGYTVAHLRVLKALNLDKIYKSYGMPNDMLVKLNILNFRVRDVEIRPIYGIGEKSGFNAILIIPKVSILIFQLFIKRMIEKYIIRDFHPLVIFYLTGIILASVGLLYGLYVACFRLFIGSLSDNSLLFSVFMFISGWQFILFAMWFDMDVNKRLR